MELYANPAATQRLLDDARISIEQWLADEVSITFAEMEGTAFISGDGVNRPRGLLSHGTVGDAPDKGGIHPVSSPAIADQTSYCGDPPRGVVCA